ncbi:DUF3025 domain-containing protein [Chromobacterium alkanivorans]|uniref:DUF3025 domain-containing protein n=1 Tax=Chromobacterium alkanivorans TaxID=1071719 RepID=UPI003B84A209
MSTVSAWQTDYLSHPLYLPVRDAAALIAPAAWPEQADYDLLLQRYRQHRPDALPAGLRFACDLEPEAYYEMHIGHTGEIPTRTGNWHDWFNALAWLAWPQSKLALNRRHLRAIARGEAKRGPLRDAATLLDECGTIVAVADPAFSRMLDDMAWQDLFLKHRGDWNRRIGVHAIGHALFEVGLRPHIGWCGKALPLQVPAEFFVWDEARRLAHLDEALARRLDDDAFMPAPRALWPLPLLGIPGWWPDNEDPAFYDNRDYFRPTRRAKSSSVTD